MLSAYQAFELMKQRAREAQARGWHEPKDLDGQRPVTYKQLTLPTTPYE
jgi:hypothetical protein